MSQYDRLRVSIAANLQALLSLAGIDRCPRCAGQGILYGGSKPWHEPILFECQMCLGAGFYDILF